MPRHTHRHTHTYKRKPITEKYGKEAQIIRTMIAIWVNSICEENYTRHKRRARAGASPHRTLYIYECGIWKTADDNDVDDADAGVENACSAFIELACGGPTKTADGR